MTDEQNTNPVPEVAVNPLLLKLKRRIPGESFRLPSRGLFYTNSELDPEVEDGEVIIYPMTTVDELKMRSVDMLFQGTAITEVIARCVPQILKPEKLIAADIDYVLTCMRKVSYGPMLPIKHKCTKCDAPEKEFNLSVEHFIRTSKEITQDQYDKMSVIVDEVYNVRLRPCNFEELIKILQRSNDNFDTAEKMSEYMDNSLSAVIKSVDGVKDRGNIMEWLGALPCEIKDELSDAVENLNQWGVEFSFVIECETCKAKEDIKSSLNPIGFFMLPSSRKTKAK